MRVIFESRDPQAAQLRELAVLRLQSAMRRISGLVPRAKVKMLDQNGPRGGVDKLCKLELHTETGGKVVIISRAKNWHAALEDALTRGTQVILRDRKRGREHPRKTLSFDS